MTDDELAEAIFTLRKMPGANFLGVLHTSHFFCYRSRNGDGAAVQEVNVTLNDRGPGHPQRFHVVAQSDDGRTATGNDHSDLVTALTLVHWDDLDKPGQ